MWGPINGNTRQPKSPKSPKTPKEQAGREHEKVDLTSDFSVANPL